MVPYEVLALVVSICGVVIAFSVMLGNNRKDAAKAEASQAEIKSALSFISDDIKEIKAVENGIRDDIKRVREIAIRAEDSAKSAHKRIDELSKGVRTYDNDNKQLRA